MKICVKTYLFILALLMLSGTFARAGVTDPVVNALDTANYYIGAAGSLQEHYVTVANDFITGKNGPLGDLKAAAKSAKRIAKLKAAAQKVKKFTGKVKEGVKDIKDNVAVVKGVVNEVKTEVNNAKSAINDVKGVANDVKNEVNNAKTAVNDAKSTIKDVKDGASAIVTRTPFASSADGNITVLPGASTTDDTYTTVSPPMVSTTITEVAPPTATVTRVPLSPQQNTAGLLAGKFAMEPAVSEVPLPLASLPSPRLLNQTTPAEVQTRAQELSEEPLPVEETPQTSTLSLEDQLRGEKEDPLDETPSDTFEELIDMLEGTSAAKGPASPAKPQQPHKAAKEAPQAAHTQKSTRRAFGSGED